METNQVLDPELYDLCPIINALELAIDQHGSLQVPDRVILDFKKELNDFFKKSPLCTNLMITNNTDKEFFGIIIKPVMDVNDIIGCPDLRDLKLIDRYSMDIDSKLFSMGLSARQLISLIINEVYNIMSMDSVASTAAIIDSICAGRKSEITASVIEYKCINNLIEYCICDYLYRSRSIFAKNEFEVATTSQILQTYSMSNDFIEAVRIFHGTTNHMYYDIPSPALALNWVFDVIKNYEPKSVYAIKVLESTKRCIGSSMMANFIQSIIKSFTSTNIEYQHKAIVGEGSLFSGIRKSGLKSLENDLYEYEMRIKNIDDENSAILLMRQINSRMGIISDYIDEEKISETERKRWESLYERYGRMREKMTNKQVYSKKMYGLFVDYNALMNTGKENMMTMNTYY